MTPAKERRLLQAAIILCSLVPLLAGGQGAWEGASMIRGVSDPVAPDLDSHYRYLSGLLLAIGLAFLSCVPRIAAQGARFRLLGQLVILGGLCRLASAFVEGWPGPVHSYALVMELVVVPLLMFWQRRVEHRFATPE